MKRMKVATPDFRPFSRPDAASGSPSASAYSGKKVSIASDRTLMYRTITNAIHTRGSTFACAATSPRRPAPRGTACGGASITGRRSARSMATAGSAPRIPIDAPTPNVSASAPAANAPIA